MMNLLGLGSHRKSSQSGGSSGESSPVGSPIRKFFPGNGKEKSCNGKVVASDSSCPLENDFVVPPTPPKMGRKASKSVREKTTSLSSSIKLKLKKTSSIGGSGPSTCVSKSVPSSPKVKVGSTIDPASFGANGTAAAVVASVIAAEDPAKKELQELRERANEVANETLMSTRRMADLCEQAKDAGIKIIVSLDDQKEQLDRVQDSLTVMREDLIHAEKNLRGMNKCCGIFINPFKKRNFKEDEKLWTDGLDGAVVAENATVPRRPFTPMSTLGWPMSKASSSKDNQSNNFGGAGHIPKITEDEDEDEMEKNMGMVSSMLGNLRNMAIDMNTEIESQNKQMTIINDMTEQNNARIDDAIQKTHDLKRQ